jgi:hypothetical protein
MMGKLKITIDIDEQTFLEAIFNYQFQGLMEQNLVIFFLSMYAMQYHWKYYKLLYYFDLLGVKR